MKSILDAVGRLEFSSPQIFLKTASWLGGQSF
jgi:hypothetical protein